MKRISILAVLVLVFFAVELFSGILETFKDSHLEEALKGIDATNKLGERDYVVDLKLKKNDAHLTDSAYNEKENATVPYVVKEVKTAIEMPPYMNILMVAIAVPMMVLIGFMLVSFVKMIASVLKRDIFNRNNVRRIRIFSYGLLASYILMEMYEYLSYNIAANQLVVEGYTIRGYFETTSLSDLLILILFAEIFSMGVRIKEEQDLTI